GVGGGVGVDVDVVVDVDVGVDVAVDVGVGVGVDVGVGGGVGEVSFAISILHICVFFIKNRRLLAYSAGKCYLCTLNVAEYGFSLRTDVSARQRRDRVLSAD
ncbi:MAG: hypothetical protein II970_04505, partial [Paludibacteraceae bacterium]|nr:hypothetical protein [Paludibacteraceae bacterium]